MATLDRAARPKTIRRDQALATPTIGCHDDSLRFQGWFREPLSGVAELHVERRTRPRSKNRWRTRKSSSSGIRPEARCLMDEKS